MLKKQEEVNIVREEVAGTTALLGPLLEGVLEDRLEGEGAVGVRGWMDPKLLIMNDLFSKLSTYVHEMKKT